jgi:hypothetical protein
MAIEPVYFGVIRNHGVETPRLFYERVPPDLLKKGSRLVYCTRLDTLPAGDRLVSQSLARLFEVYQRLRDAGRLPVENRG